MCDYQSDSSTEFTQSMEFEIIHSFSYSDVEELGLGLVNYSPEIKPGILNSLDIFLFPFFEKYHYYGD